MGEEVHGRPPCHAAAADGLAPVPRSDRLMDLRKNDHASPAGHRRPNGENGGDWPIRVSCGGGSMPPIGDPLPVHHSGRSFGDRRMMILFSR